MRLHLAKIILLLHCWIAHADSPATAEPLPAQQFAITGLLSIDPAMTERPSVRNVADQCSWFNWSRQCSWLQKTDWSAGHRWLTDFRQFFGQRWLRPHALQYFQSKVKASIRAWAVTPHDVACYGLLLDADCLTAAADLPVVILIHGFNSTPEASTELRKAVQQAGYPTGTFAYPNDYTLAASAGLLSSELKEFADQYPKRRVVLLCHSMGGLVARGCLEEAQSDPGNVDRLIMISPPNHGTNLARFAMGTDFWEHWVDRADGSTWERFHDSVIDGLGEAITELCPESEFLKRLNSQTRNPRVAYSILLGDRGFITNQDRLWLRSRLQQTVGRIPGSSGAALDALLADFDEVVEGRGDGVVAISRGQLEGVSDTVVLPYRHFSLTAQEGPAVHHEVASFVLSRLK